MATVFSVEHLGLNPNPQTPLPENEPTAFWYVLPFKVTRQFIGRT
jgi:hypothetical protein